MASRCPADQENEGDYFFNWNDDYLQQVDNDDVVEDPSDEEDTKFEICDGGKTLKIPSCYQLNDSVAEQNLCQNFLDSLEKIGYYSEDADKNFSHDSSALKYLHPTFQNPPPINNQVKLNLKIARADAQPSSGTSTQSFHNLLRWMNSNVPLITEPDADRPDENILDVDLVITGNLLLKIIYVSYSCRPPLVFYAQLVDKTVYMMSEKRERPRDAVIKSNMRHKFLQYLTAGEDVTTGSVGNLKYKVVFQAQLGKRIDILYNMNLDIAGPNYKHDDPGLENCYAVKCLPTGIKNQNRKALHDLYMSNWTQKANFSMMNTCLFGFKNEKGYVTSIEAIDANSAFDIAEPDFAEDLPFHFLVEILQFVIDKAHESPNEVLRFTKAYRTSRITCDSPEGIEKTLLPGWYDMNHNW